MTSHPNPDGVTVSDEDHSIGFWVPSWAVHALRQQWEEASGLARLREERNEAREVACHLEEHIARLGSASG